MQEILPKREPKRGRHGLTTFWLFYILLNGLTLILLFTTLQNDAEKILDVEFSDLYRDFMVTVGFLNAASAVLLLKWKKLGFHGVIISSIIKLYANLQLDSSLTAILGLTDIAILYMMLKLKKNGKSTWDWLT